MVKRERHVVNGKVPHHTPFHFLLVSLQDAMIHACVGVEVIP